jgi:hypothetical protein
MAHAAKLGFLTDELVTLLTATSAKVSCVVLSIESLNATSETLLSLLYQSLG